MVAFPTSTQAAKPKFPLGQVVATPGAVEALEKSGESPNKFLSKHVAGDWGDMSLDDKKLNDEALIDHSRIMSSYKTSKGTKLWVITEAADDTGHRECTTILLPEEY